MPKISGLTITPAAQVNPDADYVAFVDASALETKRVLLRSVITATNTLAGDVTIDGSLTHDYELTDIAALTLDSTALNVTGVASAYLDSQSMTIRGISELNLRTPAVHNGTATNGQFLALTDATEGHVEFQSLDTVAVLIGGAVADIAAGTLPGSALSTGADDTRVPLAALKNEVISALAGALNAADYLGEITSLSQSIPSAASSSGKWYSSAVAGLLTDSDVSTITVAIGDRIVSNGTAWAKYAAPPTLIADGAVTLPKLASGVSSMLNVDIPDRPDYLYSIVDAQSRIGFAVRPDGSLVGKALPADLSDVTGYQYAIVDTAGRIGFGIRTDGTIVGKVPLVDASVTTAKIATLAVTEAKLATEFVRVVKSSMTERVSVEQDDDGWRGRTFEIPATTETDGSQFVPFASTPTRSLRGINTTGTTLEFRQSAGLSIRGKRYRGTWTPGAGAPDAAPLPGDWWNCTAAGSFSGITWADGDRLVSLGTLYYEGPNWVKQIAGELFYLGEFIPASHSPSNIRDGDLWQASTSGTFSGITFAANDILIRESGAWGKITSEAVTSVANGVFYSFSVSNARQIEVRRQDKSATRVGILARGMRTTKAPRSSDAIVMWGDSMVAFNGLNTAIAALITPRVFTGVSYGGSTSAQILGAIQKEIRGADTYRGRLHAFFHGTNNIADLAQVRAAAFAMADLAGARDNRVIFMAPIGQTIMTWNGTRLVADQFEQALAGTNNIAELENWYNVAFPGQLLNCRTALLAAAASLTTPSLRFPGMTEGAVATTYGIIPLAYVFDLTSVAWTPAGLTFAGYRSTAGLPTGGTDGDYWLRTANGTVGTIIVRWAGTWTEHTPDTTHLTVAGNAVLAASFASFLTSNAL